MKPSTIFTTICALSITDVALAAVKNQKPAEGFEQVTCSSSFKLTHVSSGYKLHSHEVQYGTGSEQQSVTGMKSKDDVNSLWSVKDVGASPCTAGAPIKCRQTIRLTHVITGKKLHSHRFGSPLSGNQEVSAYGGDDIEDNQDDWIVICESGTWKRTEPVQLQHSITGKFLTASASHRYKWPIEGQLEVSAKGWTDSETKWRADEGFYIKETVQDETESVKEGGLKDEL